MLTVPLDEIKTLFAQNAQTQAISINTEFRNLELMVLGHLGSFVVIYIFRI